MFKYLYTDDGHVPPHEYLPCDDFSGGPTWGLALALSSGLLVKATGTTAPTYISMVEAGAAVTEGDLIPVIRVTPDIIFETELSAAGTSLKPGAKVTIASDALRVTATTTDGVAELVSLDAPQGIGDKVRVRFK